MLDFTNSHQNPDSDLFIETTIDSNYRAIDSINFSDSIISSTNLINPRQNEYLDNDMEDFFFYYLFEKQNDNGSFSDIVGTGNMFSTYQVIETIDNLDNSFIDTHNQEYEINKVNLIVEFLKNSLDENGYGFKLNELAPFSDIISTYCAINLAKRFNAHYLLNNENLTRFVNNTLIEADATPELTYYRIQAYLELGLEFNITQKVALYAFFLSFYNIDDGGYSMILGGESDVQSTYFAISSLDAINATIINPNKTLYYIYNCSKSDGGFGYRPDNVSRTYESDFKSGWAAMRSIQFLEKNSSIDDIYINAYRLEYYNWLYDHQAENGLFGEISLQANYWGVLANHYADPENLEDTLETKKIWNYIEDCYDKSDGGFGYKPEEDASLFSTFCALEIYEMFYSYKEYELPDINKTIDYLVDLQNSDGGFNIGLDLYQITAFFGPLREIFLSLLKTNISTVESTYWALSSLESLGALDQIDEEDLMHWIYSCQNADGGFSIILGFHSDTISTYFGLGIFKLLNTDPISKLGPIEFLKTAQNDEGSFDPMPALSLIFDLPSSFLITFFAAMGLYDYDYQPEEVEELIEWYEDCFSSNTGGMGDFPEFGGDLRNTPYAIILIEELRYDQAFNPQPWTELITVIILTEIFLIFLYGIIKAITVLNVAISRKLKLRFGIGEKFNISYLRRFPAIYCENLNVFAGGKLIVDSVSMRLEHGEILGVLGESGAGKSTFVKALLGMRKFNGINQIYGLDVSRYSKKMRPIYGYVPQQLMLYNNFTVLQNILYFGKRYDLSEKEIINRTRRILRSLEIEDKINELVKNLSGGQKRRVSIALALIHNPAILWMDEPTSGLDPVVRENLWLALTKINEQYNTTLIVITHYPEESRFCHKVAIFGRLRGMIDFGSPRELLVQIPGKGRKIELYFNQVQENVIEKLESIEGIEIALERREGTEFLLFTDLDVDTLFNRINQKFPQSIPQILQSDAQMEDYFRIKAIKVPEIE
ncbi:MAG: ATP-binding cassette domain-containing protein [Promethearchaeota archaeon]|nr:MAG: ATP-binding cassette domain-containing protein [Candidatus Lokiarchaeota archaeon]